MSIIALLMQGASSAHEYLALEPKIDGKQECRARRCLEEERQPKDIKVQNNICFKIALQ